MECGTAVIKALPCRFPYASELCNKASRASWAWEAVGITSSHSPGVASCVTLMEYRVAAKPEPYENTLILCPASCSGEYLKIIQQHFKVWIKPVLNNYKLHLPLEKQLANYSICNTGLAYYVHKCWLLKTQIQILLSCNESEGCSKQNMAEKCPEYDEGRFHS